MSVLCIPAECDNIKKPYNGVIASRWDAYFYATFAGISLRLCSISLRSFRITFAAYLPTHIKSLWDFLAYNSDTILNINHLERTRNIASLPCKIVLGDSSLLFWKGGFAPILAKFLVSLHPKILMRLDNELLMNLLAVTLGKS